MKVLVVDYKMNNLGSIKRALEYCGATVIVSSDPSELKNADKIVIPGVGAFSDAMKNLEQLGWVSALKDAVLIEKKFLLGICLGMQLLAEEGHEGGCCQGLGLIEGKVIKLISSNKTERIPHVGWNEVFYKEQCQLFKNITSGTDFYFVHSYHFVTDGEQVSAACTQYCGGFVSAVNKNNIFGVQFHPEKSMPAGLILLKNFVNIDS